MRRVIVFNMVTVDGYIADKNGDMSWARKQDPEWNEFVQGNARGSCVLLFGRKTYDLMAGFWPTVQAMQAMPEVAESMNSLPKIVFSKTMDAATWKNTTLVKDDPAERVRKMKAESGDDMMIFGSGTIISQLAREGLIDEYQMAVSPVALGDGRTMFEGIGKKLELKLTKTRVFENGNVLLFYEPVG